MKKQTVYRLLESKMLDYSDYADVPLQTNDESFVAITPSTHLVGRQIDPDMLAVTGNTIYVRQSVHRRLVQASTLLAAYDATLQLEVVYGYRSLAIQTALFEKHKQQLSDTYSGNELLAAVHRLVAIPQVAGHPAGAAVDIQIIKNGSPIDFGTAIHEFSPDTFTFSPFISSQAWANRQLLRRVLINAGFAPFDGEWWHFSYGDKEWVSYYNRPFALYNQVVFSA